VIYLFDTDHISLVQRGSGAAYTTLVSHIAQHSPTDIAFSIISMHEQVLGCHTYINRARSSRDVVEGYEMLEQVLQDFSTDNHLEGSSIERYSWGSDPIDSTHPVQRGGRDATVRRN
jgi:tRNA(fMet)-specific endonuclease VapC